jgi:5-formyltetrahydrofolate cyclo-ligase
LHTVFLHQASFIRPGMAISDDKALVRREALARRDAFALDVELAMEAAQGLCALALTLPALSNGAKSCLAGCVASPVAGYWPIRGEIDPRPILLALSHSGVALALPVIVADDLVFRAWQPWQPLVPAGGFGTLGPPPGAASVTPRILLVPLAAFDRSGARLGYGKGYYDRAIARLGVPGPVTTIGLAFACQEVAQVPTAPHDRRLDAIVTERETILPLPSAD